MNHILSQSIYDLYVVKIYDDTPACATRNIRYLVSLNCDLDVFIACHNGKFEMITRFTDCIEKGSTSEVDANMTFLDNVKTIQNDCKERD
jgi:hypothetical protein